MTQAETVTASTTAKEFNITIEGGESSHFKLDYVALSPSECIKDKLSENDHQAINALLGEASDKPDSQKDYLAEVVQDSNSEYQVLYLIRDEKDEVVGFTRLSLLKDLPRVGNPQSVLEIGNTVIGA